jgi:hypothetical protein
MPKARLTADTSPSMTDPRSIATRLLGAIDWQNEVSGFCSCPREAMHTTRTGKKDYRVELERVSFKGTVDGLRQFTQTMTQAPSPKRRRELWRDLLSHLARDLVPSRPGRREPRAVKHRPKPFPLLTRPRHLFKDRISYDRWLRLRISSNNRRPI